ncbi:hypothetical protein Syun_004736 [Stephania yunnanensis]|uniref:Uncharacterized protein n=1 Tax=Stephania yunnanensis TaxID=152371 RepID=A0AAP0L6X7_9MAGN
MDSISLQKPNNDQKVDGDGDFLFGEEAIYGSMLPMVLRAVIKLNVLEIMNKAPTTNLSAYQIASQIPNNKNPDAHIMLDRILGFLACHSVLTCTTQLSNAGKVERLYGLSPACNCFLENNEDGASLSRLLLLVHSERAQDCWLYLDEVVLQPNFSAMEKVYGAKSYDHLETDVTENELFNKATSDHTAIVMRRILDKYKGFENVKVVVDVGGGIGTNINMIVSKYPTIKGINFDLPRVVETALSYPGVEHVGGDMFASVPKGDAIFMKSIVVVVSSWRTRTNCHGSSSEIKEARGEVSPTYETQPGIGDGSPMTLNWAGSAGVSRTWFSPVQDQRRKKKKRKRWVG